VRIRNMLDQRLEILQMEQGERTSRPGEVDMSDLLRHAIEDVSSMAKQRCVNLRVIIGETSIQAARPVQCALQCPIQCPIQYQGLESLLYTMTLNLLVNAVEASSQGGEVLVRLEPGLEPESDQLDLFITNQGEVPREIRGRFAQKYMTAGKPRGRGLGTYSARLAAEAHHGSLTLDDSTPGQTTIRVCLPWTDIRQPDG